VNEDWDDMAVAEPLAGEELERMLARFARVRLDPGPARVRRARAAVMEEAWRRRIAANAPAPARRGLFAGWSARRLGVSFSAAVLAGLMLGTSVFGASRAGGPLYETRLAVEALGLPSDPAARVDAQLEAAQARLAEAVEAAGHRDEAATLAALAAYDRVIAELMSAEGDAADRALEAVQFHHTVLLEVAARVPDAATSGIDRALANSERVIERLTSNGASAPGRGNGNGNGNGNGGAGTPGGRPTASPEATDEVTPKPGRTKDPAATPKPARTQAPEPTEKPERSRPPRPTPNPGNPGDASETRQPAPSKGKP
jgi:hypothetical protein